MATNVVSRPARIVTVVAVLAVLFDVLVMQHQIGIGLGIAGSLFAAAVWFGKPVLSLAPTATAKALAGVLALVAWVPAVRAAEVLVFYAVAGTAGLGLLCVRVLASDDLWSWTVGGYAKAIGTSALAGIVETFDFVTTDVSFGKAGNRTGRILVGLLVVVPVLVVFAVLFAGADAVFSRMLTDIVDVDLGRFMSHALTVAALTWAGVGMLRYALRVETTEAESNQQPRLVVEATTGLVAIAALFAAFVAVQFAYLFGGLETNTGLTYAEYARRGFFELVTVGALVVLLALAVDRLVQGVERSHAVDTTLTALIAETLIVLASAVVRLNLYIDAFGLTEARFYAAAFLVWAAVVLVLVAAMLLRGRRARFAFASFVTAVALFVAAAAVNPDAVIARTNLTKSPVDTEYLTSLSADAVPSLVGEIDPAVLCDMADTPGDWRSATMAETRALAALRNAGESCGS